MPPAVGFATKGQLAQAMLARAFAADVPAAWVTGDEVYGNTSTLRAWLEEEQRPYVLAVACDHLIWTGAQQQRADEHFAALPADAWVALSAGEGSQGPRLYDWAWSMLPGATTPGMSLITGIFHFEASSDHDNLPV